MSAFGGKAAGRSPSRQEKGNAAFTASISLYRSTWRGCARRQSGWRSDGPPLHQPCPCGEWFVVPDAAVVTEPNRFGPAVVWPYNDRYGNTQIRCFMPG